MFSICFQLFGISRLKFSKLDQNTPSNRSEVQGSHLTHLSLHYNQQLGAKLVVSKKVGVALQKPWALNVVPRNQISIGPHLGLTIITYPKELIFGSFCSRETVRSSLGRTVSELLPVEDLFLTMENPIGNFGRFLLPNPVPISNFIANSETQG